MDSELERRGIADTLIAARDLVLAGRVLVSGSVATNPARLVLTSEPIELASGPRPFVSRGGEKLAAVLEQLEIDVTEMRCLDVGSSTGGFTDCLLQRGASSVVALDVGRGQLDWGIRSDPRVASMERTDVRDADPDDLGSFDLIVIDVSFISLRTVMPAIAALARSATVLALVKPQFEVWKDLVGRGGVVRDESLHTEAVRSVIEAAQVEGLRHIATVESAITGTKGNREFFVHLKKA